jgi:hypothetical protein
MASVGLDILSYDNYVLFEDGKLKDSFFRNLEVVKHTAVEYGAKASNFILAIWHTSSAQGVTYAPPSEASLRWQLACDLAYGYDMTMYYTYSTPTDNTGWVYAPGIIDRNGEKTDIYGYAKTVNNEIHAWEKTYMNFVSGWEGVAAVNAGMMNAGFMYLKNSLDIEEVAGIKDIAADEDLLVGVFKDAAQNKGFMVTNASNPLDNKYAKFTVQFDSGYKGVQVFEKGEPRIIELDKNGGAAIELEPGEGKFLIPLKAK